MTQWNDSQGRQPENWEAQQTQYIPRDGGQPPQGQPAQGNYAQPRRQGQPAVNPFGASSNDTFGITGMVFALLGGVVGIVAFTALDWFTASGPGGGKLSFSDLNDVTDNAQATGFASAYFSYLAWVFLIVTVIAAVGSSFPSPAVRALRVIGVVVGVAAAGLSFLAIRLSDGVDYTDFLKHASVGFYLAVIAFLLAAVGAAIGPTKV